MSDSLLKIIDNMIAMGYKITPGGICFGVANMSMQTFLASDNASGAVEKFNKRLCILNRLSEFRIESLKDKLIKNQITLMEPVTADGLEIPLYELLAFTDGIALYQKPDSYKTILSSELQPDRAASSLVTPVELDSEENHPICAYEFSGCYNQDDLNTYLQQLQTHLSIPTALLLLSSNHAINLNFDPQNQTWILTDSSFLSKTYTDSSQLAAAIIAAFDVGRQSTNTAIFSTKAFVQSSEKNTIQSAFATLGASEPWMNIHQITPKKIHASDAFNSNWIRIAANNGDTETVRRLINAGIEVNQADKENGATPLYIAAQNGYDTVVKTLLENKAKVNQAKKGGVTPLYIAAQKGHDTIVILLLKNKAKVNQAKKDGFTPLHIAALMGHDTIAKRLLENKAKVNQADNRGATPLYIAAENGHIDTVKLLIEKSADVNQADNRGNTPLLIAVENGHIDIVKLLLEQNADVDQANNNGMTPLLIAIKNGHTELINLLEANGAENKENVNPAMSLLTKTKFPNKNSRPAAKPARDKSKNPWPLNPDKSDRLKVSVQEKIKQLQPGISETGNNKAEKITAPTPELLNESKGSFIEQIQKIAKYICEWAVRFFWKAPIEMIQHVFVINTAAQTLQPAMIEEPPKPGYAP